MGSYYVKQARIKSENKRAQQLQSFGHSQYKAGFFRYMPSFFDQKTKQIILAQKWQWSSAPKQFCDLMKYLKRTQCKSFRICLSQTQREHSTPILKRISQVCFSSLTSIDISYNQISNIEVLAFLDVQKIQSLELHTNFITINKPFSKTNWKSLFYIQIHGNYIHQIELARTFLPKLKILHTNLFTTQLNQVEDPRLLLKCQFTNLRMLTLSSKYQIIYKKSSLEKLQAFSPSNQIFWGKKFVHS